jgi:two-component system LytT family sensor kinase
MKAFQKFILLVISLFTVVGIFTLSAGKPFFDRFTLDVFGFLAIMQFIFPALAYVYVYEKILVKKNINLKKPQGIDKTLVIIYGLVFVVSYIFSFLMIYFATGKVEFETSFVTATAINNFVFIAAALDIHKRYDSIPVFKLNEKPFYYLKLFFFSILGVCAYLLAIFALATLQFHKKLEVTSTQFIIDCILYAIMAVNLAFFVSYVLNKMVFFRKSILFSIVITTITTFLAIKLLGYPQDYFRVLFTGYVLEMITFGLCLMIVFLPIARANRNFKINKLTSDFSKKEAEYLQLKQQVNPHFLFNNLNTLISFIEIDSKKAVEFGHHLSNTYRHYLKNQNDDFVSLKEELEFIKEYLAIYKAKFENSFSFEISVLPKENEYIVCLSLQEIVDNVFKHNTMDENNPLEIRISSLNNGLLIENTVSKKANDLSNGLGLENINKRYMILTNKEIQIVNHTDKYQVTLPILELEA